MQCRTRKDKGLTSKATHAADLSTVKEFPKDSGEWSARCEDNKIRRYSTARRLKLHVITNHLHLNSCILFIPPITQCHGPSLAL